MRTVNLNEHALRSPTRGVLAAAALVVAACGTGGPSMTAAYGTSALAVAVAAHGQGNAHMRITASDEATGAVEAVEHVDVQGGSTAQLVFDLPPSSYAISVAAFSDTNEQVRIADGTAHATLAARATTVVDLSLTLPPASGGGGGSVKVEMHEAPLIQSVAISGDGALGGSLSQTLSLATGDATLDFTATPAVKIGVNAAAAGGGMLRYFWLDGSGAAAVEAGAVLNVSAQSGPRAVVGGATRVIRLVVQDAKGAASVVTVELKSAVAGTFTAVHATVARAADDVSKIATCVEAHATCAAHCDLTPDGQLACLGSCGLQLAVCEGN